MSSAPATVVIGSPVGPLELTARGDTLTGVRILPGAALSGEAAGHPVLAQAIGQLADYFAGKCRVFDLPLEPAGTQRGGALRAGIAGIAYGETLSYGALANILDSGPRAVGQACRRNPFPIIIPCHRVTSANGAPEHYSGGDGINTKAWLNSFEQQHKDG